MLNIEQASECLIKGKRSSDSGGRKRSTVRLAVGRVELFFDKEGWDVGCSGTPGMVYIVSVKNTNTIKY